MSQSRANLAAVALSTLAVINAVCTTAFALPRPFTVDEPTETFASLRYDNDATAIGLFTYGDSDRYYTAGLSMRFGLGSVALGKRPSLRTWLARRAGADFSSVAGGIRLLIFTPTDTIERDVQPQDRPFAGVLVADLEQRLWFNGNLGFAGRSMLRLAVSGGVLGPASFADQAQNTFHDWRRSRSGDLQKSDPYDMKSPRVDGWRHQVGMNNNLVTIQLRATYDALLACTDSCGRTNDALPNWRAAVSGYGDLQVGTIEGTAALGFIGRAGWMLPSISGQFVMRRNSASSSQQNPASGIRVPSSPPSSPQPSPPSKKSASAIRVPSSKPPTIAAFTRVEIAAVAWNRLLSGGGGSHGVAPHPLVVQAEGGATVAWWCWSLTWSVTALSREFTRPVTKFGWREEWLSQRGWFPDHFWSRIEARWLF